MSNTSRIMDTTVELVSAFMSCINCNGLHVDDESAKQYAEFIETVYKKVEELTVTE